MFRVKKITGLKKLALTTFSLLGTSLLTLDIDTSPVLAKDPVDAVCKNRLNVNNSSNLKVPYCANKPLGDTDATVENALIVVHGTGRNADDYYERMRNAAIEAGRLNETIIISPQYLLKEDKDEFNLGNDFLYWTNGGWKRGDDSRSSHFNKFKYIILNSTVPKLLDSIFSYLSTLIY